MRISISPRESHPTKPKDNIMPANAASWYMAKCRYYFENIFSCLMNYPKRRAIEGSST